jgi:hypothetical protein
MKERESQTPMIFFKKYAGRKNIWEDSNGDS